MPRTQSPVLAEKFADFEFGACKLIIRVWQAKAGCSYRVTSWVSLHTASLQATQHDTAKFSVTLAVRRDKSVVFPCSTLSPASVWLKAIGLYPQAVCVLLSLHLVFVVDNNICIKAGRQEVIPTFQIWQTFRVTAVAFHFTAWYRGSATLHSWHHGIPSALPPPESEAH